MLIVQCELNNLLLDSMILAEHEKVENLIDCCLALGGVIGANYLCLNKSIITMPELERKLQPYVHATDRMLIRYQYTIMHTT